MAAGSTASMASAKQITQPFFSSLPFFLAVQLASPPLSCGACEFMLCSPNWNLGLSYFGEIPEPADSN